MHISHKYNFNREIYLKICCIPMQMPNYANTVIYKIYCLTESINDIYVGHTTNLDSRKTEHKYAYHNESYKSYNIKVYNFIRSNGGWEKWAFEEIEKYPCNSKQEACVREHFWYFELKSTLNDLSPILDQEKILKREKAIKEKAAEIAKQNAEERKAARRKYLEDNKEEIKKHKKDVRADYSKRNRLRINENMKEYRKLNPEKIKQIAKKAYETRKTAGYYDKPHDT